MAESRETMLAALASRLAGIVGRDQIVADPAALRRYAGGPWGAVDPTGHFGFPPALAIRPADGAQVAASLAEIERAGLGAIALGGGTGLTGAGLPGRDSVVLDLDRLRHPFEIDPASRRARVGAAVRLLDLAVAARAEGLLFAHDPWSAPLASVGGAISTNGVGYLAAGYGTMGAQVLGLDVALATGEVLSLSSAITSSTGPDLNRLFVGAEGTLGVIVAATVKLYPWPERRLLGDFRFPSFAHGFEALQAGASLGVRLTMIDYEADEDQPTATLHVAVDDVAGAAEAILARFTEIALRHCAEVRPDAEADEFWRDRHAASASFESQREELWRDLAGRPAARRRPRARVGSRYVHVALPAGQVLDFYGRARRTAAARGVELSNPGIWGSPDLFSFILHGPAVATDATADELVLAAARQGGSIEYCHGVGLRLAHLMPDAMGAAWPVLRRIKAALDPGATLNPEKQGLPGRSSGASV